MFSHDISLFFIVFKKLAAERLAKYKSSIKIKEIELKQRAQILAEHEKEKKQHDKMIQLSKQMHEIGKAQANAKQYEREMIHRNKCLSHIENENRKLARHRGALAAYTARELKQTRNKRDIYQSNPFLKKGANSLYDQFDSTLVRNKSNFSQNNYERNRRNIKKSLIFQKQKYNAIPINKKVNPKSLIENQYHMLEKENDSVGKRKPLFQNFGKLKNDIFQNVLQNNNDTNLTSKKKKNKISKTCDCEYERATYPTTRKEQSQDSSTQEKIPYRHLAKKLFENTISHEDGEECNPRPMCPLPMQILNLQDSSCTQSTYGSPHLENLNRTIIRGNQSNPDFARMENRVEDRKNSHAQRRAERWSISPPTTKRAVQKYPVTHRNRKLCSDKKINPAVWSVSPPSFKNHSIQSDKHHHSSRHTVSSKIKQKNIASKTKKIPFVLNRSKTLRKKNIDASTSKINSESRIVPVKEKRYIHDKKNDKTKNFIVQRKNNGASISMKHTLQSPGNQLTPETMLHRKTKPLLLTNKAAYQASSEKDNQRNRNLKSNCTAEKCLHQDKQISHCKATKDANQTQTNPQMKLDKYFLTKSKISDERPFDQLKSQKRACKNAHETSMTKDLVNSLPSVNKITILINNDNQERIVSTQSQSTQCTNQTREYSQMRLDHYFPSKLIKIKEKDDMIQKLLQPSIDETKFPIGTDKNGSNILSQILLSDSLSSSPVITIKKEIKAIISNDEPHNLKTQSKNDTKKYKNVQADHVFQVLSQSFNDAQPSQTQESKKEYNKLMNKHAISPDTNNKTAMTKDVKDRDDEHSDHDKGKEKCNIFENVQTLKDKYINLKNILVSKKILARSSKFMKYHREDMKIHLCTYIIAI